MIFNLATVAFSSTHLKSTIKVQDHPAELNISLGHSDSYTGVKQSTLTTQPLNTSGQGKYNQTLSGRENLPSSYSQISWTRRIVRRRLLRNYLRFCRTWRL